MMEIWFPNGSLIFLFYTFFTDTFLTVEVPVGPKPSKKSRVDKEEIILKLEVSPHCSCHSFFITWPWAFSRNIPSLVFCWHAAKYTIMGEALGKN